MRLSLKSLCAEPGPHSLDSHLFLGSVPRSSRILSFVLHGTRRQDRLRVIDNDRDDLPALVGKSVIIMDPAMLNLRTQTYEPTDIWIGKNDKPASY